MSTAPARLAAAVHLDLVEVLQAAVILVILAANAEVRRRAADALLARRAPSESGGAT